MSMGAPHKAGLDCATLAAQVNEGWKSLKCTEALQLIELELTACGHWAFCC